MATKIIKPGKTPDAFRFKCPHCDCIFETDGRKYASHMAAPRLLRDLSKLSPALLYGW